MKKTILVITTLSIVTLSLFSFFVFRKSVSLSIEGKFGTFCLNCSVFEKGNAVGAYGFGLAYCDEEIRKMSNTVKYDEIDKFKFYLERKGLFNVLDKVSEIEQNLKSNNNEKYFYATQEYINEIEHLNQTEKVLVLSYFKSN